MQEKAIEKALKNTTEKHGGMCLKLHPDSMVGLPDRLIILPGGHYGFIELKQTGKKPRPIQKHRHAQLRTLGAQVHTIDNTNQIKEVLHAIQTT
ncbi:VRR-NUC domain-containing protein [Corynebacterium cystitidis]|uniref:VRR-NUC domain-containing protein n=1 Tax=Corynebacterium cystitidis TaxID=35757 RepID=UPI00211E58B0|nr:VRR-NUC domain-containing protein [Corynebacterium cystitidis]